MVVFASIVFLITLVASELEYRAYLFPDLVGLRDESCLLYRVVRHDEGCQRLQCRVLSLAAHLVEVVIVFVVVKPRDDGHLLEVVVEMRVLLKA